MNLQNWKRQAQAHWRKFQPKRYRRLERENLLEKALDYAVEQTHKEMSELEDAGMYHQEAWEMVRERYLFPPEEEPEKMDKIDRDRLKEQHELVHLLT